jgi:hypothetical protein
VQSGTVQPQRAAGLIVCFGHDGCGGPRREFPSISAATDPRWKSPMLAAMIKAFGKPAEVLELVDVPEPTGPAAGEALVASSTRRSLLRFCKVGR